MEDALSLYELNRQVTQTLSARFASPIWITAEIAQLNVASNGHCYLELIEKHTSSGATLARAKAMVWASRWWLVKESFEQGSGQRLQAGLRVLVQVQVNMHEVYGYSLSILDIDPSYTLGEMQRRRLEILRRLADEGMLEANGSLPLPCPIQRIAIISADTAAGYGDFCHQLEHNDCGLRFYTHLFPAAMQGDQTERSVIQALERVYEYQELFDVVVIIRGGGSTVDLNSFDSYELALHVANFPLPVLVGIGHERDNTVLDAVAHTSVKTPTAAAAFLIERLTEELANIEHISETVQTLCRRRLDNELQRLDRYTSVIQGSHLRLGQHLSNLDLMQQRIKMMLQIRMERERQSLDFIQRSVALSQPDNILRRGFSIARHQGHAVKDASLLQPGDIIVTETAQGSFTSVVREQKE